jgi:hypothetical protein
MNRAAILLIVVAGMLASGCHTVRTHVTSGPSPAARVQAEQEQSAARIAALERQRLRWPEDHAVIADAAKTAWTVIDRGYQQMNGFVAIDPYYPYSTMWDIGSMLAAFYSARGLGLITQPEYENRTRTLLTTLAGLPLTKHRLFNKAYDMRTDHMARVGGGAAADSGWSATDLGRLLVWLRIVSTTPELARLAEAIVARNDFASIVRDGYLRGEARDRTGHEVQYGEGVVGYEQYAARGFALWGLPVGKALSLTANALPITVMGETLYADYRRYDRLTNEPFLLWGLELGWDPATARFARRLLRAQEERYRNTGIMTITGEDAMSEPPYYFYYYCVYTNGMDFALDAQDKTAAVDGPRWISAKSAFAFHVLMPTAYTDTAIHALGAAHSDRGWASGVYEGSGRTTGNISVNTAAVILEAALVDATGGPLLQANTSH